MSSYYEIYYGDVLKVFIYEGGPAAVRELIESLGHSVVDEPGSADIAVAPLLTKRLTKHEYMAPRYGTLIFHPSLLPRHRGPDAIKWAYKSGEGYTGVTWFWCADGYDTGDICEQEVIPLDKTVRPRDFYSAEVIPAMLRTLERVLGSISRGHVRKVPQYEPAATYEGKA